MKKLLSAISLCSIAVLGLTVSTAHASLGSKLTQTTVGFVTEDKGQQYFACTVSDPTATVIIQTQDVDIQGICPSGSGPVPASTFNTHYFTVNGAGIDPYVTLTVTKGYFVNCPPYGTLNPPAGKPYKHGKGGFCLTSNTQNH